MCGQIVSRETFMIDKHIGILKEYLIENKLPYSSDIINRFTIYTKLLKMSPHNLTAIKDIEEIIIKHFIDSISLAKFYKNFDKNVKILDIGTGAGFPGIPLKILFPEIELYLIESIKKKTEFIKNLIDKLAISGIIILNERAELLAHRDKLRESFDLVVSRAFAELPILLEISAPFSKVNGLVVAYKGKNVKEELERADKAIKILKLFIKDIYFYNLPLIDYKRSLIFFEKLEKTLERYPRRPGIPQKRPLI